MSNELPGFWSLAASRNVLMRALRVSLLVGTVLGIINHGDAVLNGTFDLNNALKVLLTYFVPYAVATYSAVRALQAQMLTAQLQE